MVVIPKNRHGHIFRDSPGHLRDTPENRKLLLDMVSGPENLAGYDKWGHAWYVAGRSDGSQLWAIVRDDEIVNGGLNRTPRRFHPRSGEEDMKKLTEEQAYQAMRLFLEKNWRRSETIDVAQLLSETNTEIWADQGSGDPAARAEWRACVDEVLKGKLAAAE